MDPNEALRKLRDMIGPGWDRVSQQSEAIAYSDLCESFVEQFHALDEWLVKGGFLPTEWDPGWRLQTLAGEHGLDWADNGQGYSGRCDCGEWARTDVETFDALLGLYEVHLRVSGVPDHRKAQT